MNTPSSTKNTLEYQSLEWDKIVTSSHSLMHLAEQKSWSKLSTLHQQRDQLIEQFFSEEPHPELLAQIQSDIIKICEQDRKIVQMVADNRDQLGAEAQRLRAMKNRINQYMSTEQP